MPYRSEFPVDVAQATMKLVTLMFGLLALLEGYLIAFGSESRWRSLDFVYASRIPGDNQTWGLVLVLIGCFVLWGSRQGKGRIAGWGLSFMSFWYFTFSFALLLSVLDNVEVSRSSTVSHFFIGLFCVVMASTNFRRKRLE